MNTFRLVISSPNGHVYDGDAVMLTVRGIAGDLAVMAGHIPFVTTLQPCDCKIEFDDDSERFGHVDGGLLTVSKDAVTLLTGSFRFTDANP